MAKKIGIIVLLCFSLCVGGVSAFANEGHDETDTQTLIETQPPVSSVLLRQDGADIQQSTDEGKTWQSYSPIEKTDYFTYVIGDSVDSSTSIHKTQEDFGEVFAYTYDQLVRTAEKRLFHLKAKLEEHYNQFNSEDYVNTILNEPEQLRLNNL